MSAPAEDKFFARFDLTKTIAPDKTPAAHQTEALEALYRWHESHQGKDAGGILTIPTGGGKTFTAIRFLCREPLSNGYKVLWLAHTHHLLEQAFGAFKEGAKHVRGRSELNVRTVSGAPGHWPVSRIKTSDDVVLGTLQTLTRAYKREVESLDAFIEAAGDKLVIVFDEAHHSPANTYRKLLMELRDRVPAVHLLGMTATPTYSDEEKRGWLGELFPQEILYQASASKLIADGILAKPRIEEVKLEFTPQFDAEEYSRWSRSNRDLPQSIIDQLAGSRDRNLHIVEHYVKHRERYGKTLVFCDRAAQCVALEEMFEKRGVRADSVYSHTAFDGRTAEERNNRTRDHNAKAIAAFKRGDLDVLTNIRILTEGTDVPDAETVFLTRQTTSRILLTQMVGRAMRGPKFGGTDEAHIVSFIDNWKHLIHWAEVTELAGGLDDEEPDYGERPPVQLISVELVRRLARQMDSGVNVNELPFTEMLPIGWYRVEYEVPGEYDDVEQVRELLIVYDDQRESFDQLIADLAAGTPEVFEQELVESDGLRTTDRIEEHVDRWCARLFGEPSKQMDNVRSNIRAIARHVAQQGRAPEFYPFDRRDEHDLDGVAQHVINEDLRRSETNTFLTRIYGQQDRFWDQFYPTYVQFKSAFDACINRIETGAGSAGPQPWISEEPPDREPSEEMKQEVIARDRWRCLCCDYERRAELQVDHVRSFYHGGGNSMSNLQTLCKRCNRIKSERFINFRVHRSPLREPPENIDLAMYPPEKHDHIKSPDWWGMYLKRVVNFFYECDAVNRVEIGQAGEGLRHWTIHLFSGNEPKWLEPFLEKLVDTARAAREASNLTTAPETITLAVRGQQVVGAPAGIDP